MKYNTLMFQIENINETFIKQFTELGITNEEEITTIINGFNQIAEIGYKWYINNQLKNSKNND